MYSDRADEKQFEKDIKDNDTSIRYYLSKTMMRINGNVTEKYNIYNGKFEKKVDNTLSMVVEADANHFFYYRPKVKKFRDDAAITLNFTDDGRLGSSKWTSEGVIIESLKSFIQFGSSVVGTFAHNVIFRAEMAVPPEEKVEEEKEADPFESYKDKKTKYDNAQEKYKECHPVNASRRDSLKLVITALSKRLNELGKQYAGLKDISTLKKMELEKVTKEDKKEIVKEINTISKLLRQFQWEYDQIEKHFNSWKAIIESEKKYPYDLTIDIMDLPSTKEIETWIKNKKKKKLTKKELGKYLEIYETTGIIISTKDVMKEEIIKAVNIGCLPLHNRYYDVIIYRIPRIIEFTLYIKDEDQFSINQSAMKKEELRLVSREYNPVLDEECTISYTKMENSWFGKKCVDIAFHESGALKTLDNNEESELKHLGKGLSEIPEQIRKGLEESNSIIDQQQLLAYQKIDQQITELENKKKLIDADVAYSDAVISKYYSDELSKIAKLQAFLEANKVLKDSKIEIGFDDDNYDDIKAKYLELEIELERLKLEYSKVT